MSPRIHSSTPAWLAVALRCRCGACSVAQRRVKFARAVGGGVSATSLRRSAPASRVVRLSICSRVTPGWSETTVISLVSRIGLEDAEIGDELGRPLGLDAEPRAVIAALAVAERGDEVELLDEAARRLAHDDEDLAAGGGDLRRAAAAGQPHLRLVVGADHRGVEVGEAVDLRAAEEADGDAPALQPVAEHLRHRDGGQRGVAQFAVADRQRQHVGLGGDGAGLVDQRDVRARG